MFTDSYFRKASNLGLVAALMCAAPRASAEQQYVAIGLGKSSPDTSIGFGSCLHQQVGMTYGENQDNWYLATLWRGSHESLVNLHPAGFLGSYAIATDGVTQVGYAFGTATNQYTHAALWHGSASSYQDLNPIGTTTSRANGVSGSLVVGEADAHAVLWNTATSTVIDLHPANATFSGAYAITGNLQAGSARIGSNIHAGIWHGSAASWVDLNPANTANSAILGTSNTQQVGRAQGLNDDGPTAALWSGSAQSYMNLGADLASSTAYATNGKQQVGVGLPHGPAGQATHAVVWSGSSQYEDLQQFLPAAFESSEARGIDTEGNILGTAFYPYTYGSQGEAFLWVPVPEPTSLMWMIIAILPLRTGKRRSNGKF